MFTGKGMIGNMEEVADLEGDEAVSRTVLLKLKLLAWFSRQFPVPS